MWNSLSFCIPVRECPFVRARLPEQLVRMLHGSTCSKFPPRFRSAHIFVHRNCPTMKSYSVVHEGLTFLMGAKPFPRMAEKSSLTQKSMFSPKTLKNNKLRYLVEEQKKIDLSSSTFFFTSRRPAVGDVRLTALPKTGGQILQSSW